MMALNQIPYDMCFVKDYTVAVTLSRVHKVVLVDVEKHKLIQDIELSYECFGVSSDGEVLVISHAMEAQVLVYNLKDMSSNILEGIDANRVSLFEGIIYGTNRWNNTVFSFRITGELLWTLNLKDISSPEGIAVHTNGLVYISSYDNNRIVVLSSDGKTSRTILCEEDGIKDPFAMGINRETGTLLCSSFTKGKEGAFAFKI
ncbi:unnamed protein product [Mytilus coruscus]|uniref:Uncharacterized protein n=1 Tax=Mytilus coruscus TaxID=42192 RepID=A0A6J7ZWV7_MYTCO|nr:unnamed protein product [Mytilus coruscus]